MKTAKVWFTILFCAFLTQTRAQGVIGADINYAHQGGNTYLCSLTVFSDILIDTAFYDFGSGTFDTIVINQSPFGGGYMGIFTGSHTFPGAGTYTLNASIPYWKPSISNMTSSGTQLVNLSGSIIISPFFAANYSVQWGYSPMTVQYSGGTYMHDPGFVTFDSDSVGYTIVPVTATGYQLPSQMGGSESIVPGTFLNVTPATNGLYAMGIRATDYKETSPGQYVQAGHIERVLVINALAMDVPEASAASWTVYPNPAIDHIQFPDNESYDVLVFDMQGKQVLHQQSVKNKLNVSTLTAGTYGLYVVNNRNGKGSAVKFTKQ